MAEARDGEAEQELLGGIQTHPRDLLRQFSGDTRAEERGSVASANTGEDSGEIELSLGLSLGGCFGVDSARKRGLHRSSSIASLPFLQQGEHEPAAPPMLKRTSSLPVETEEEQRKRKAFQYLQLMEAKRKTSEASSTYQTGPRDWSASSAGWSYSGGGRDTKQGREGIPPWGGKSELEQPRGLSKLSQFGAAAAVLPNGVTAAAPHGWATTAAVRGLNGVRRFVPMSQGSVGSQGSSSSGLSDLDSRPPNQEEYVNGNEPRRSTSIPSLPKLTEHNSPICPTPSTVTKPGSCAGTEEVEEEDPTKKPAVGRGNGMLDMMGDMPCVSTRGDGPGGRRVEGFLYRYRKGEEVRIVCVCHGRFLSPAEFVKHAGGGDVAHPLRHIIVNTSASSFL